MGRGGEKNGVLELLAPAGKKPLATLTLSGLGIYRLAENTFAAPGDAIARVEATMYCERVGFTIDSAMDSPSAAGSPAPVSSPQAGAPSRADVITPLGDRLTARRQLLGQLRTR
jgi:hypothetical protein